MAARAGLSKEGVLVPDDRLALSRAVSRRRTSWKAISRDWRLIEECGCSGVREEV